MDRIVINTGNHESVILVGEKWTNMSDYIPSKGVVIITDENVSGIYGDRFPGFPVIELTPGEKSKSLSVIESAALKLLDSGIDRTGFILAIGGGVVCDLAGFLASVYMRGISFGFVSTSLLSQVDASVGGKNAVNLGNTKNIIGTFTQPEFVICDPSMLATLPEDEYLSGLSELIKMGIIMDAGLFDEIENRRTDIMNRDIQLMESLINRSVQLKAAVVREDEKESGMRMILNFGHTFGHVIESATGIKHGFAVASGMVLAAEASVLTGYLSRYECDRIISLLDSFRLLGGYSIPSGEFEKKLFSDKKKNKDSMNFVFLETIGMAKVERRDINDLISIYNNIRSIK